ncbi:gamma-glutamyltransferase [Candidatus Bathyarchaeota archaeon]|nr:gamma-glutamyltransferase [Candidatus Bathyarchaeota archaeon]
MSMEDFIHQARRWSGATRHDCISPHGMVASKHRLISEAGVRVLKKGGNVVDAAVAAAFMDCVVEPAMNGIGGEGVMAIHLKSGENVIIDYVGRPSKACKPDMYELEDTSEPGWMGWKKVKEDANVVGYKACVVPGTVAGLSMALERYGTMKLREVIEQAAKVAKDGFVVGWWTANHIFRRMEAFWKFDEWRKVYLRKGKFPYLPYTNELATPHLLRNPELAKCLKDIAKMGPEVFYKGWISETIASDMAENGGLLTKDDFAAYEPILLEPEPGSYRGYDVVYDPTHSGTTMMQILNIMEGYDLAEMGYRSAKALHIVSEAIGLAFADRFKYMGDPGYVDVPQKSMVSKEYTKKLREKINPEESIKIKPGDPWPYEPECTTALTVADKDGNMVAINQTLVNSFGSGVVIPGTGIVMNNAMYGLDPEPGTANSIDGRKRRIQNVCPTIVLKEGESYMTLGAPGGRNIQVSIAQVIHHVIDYGMNMQDAVDAPRVTRETSTVYLDSRFPTSVRDQLLSMGHDLKYIDPELKSWGRPVGILREDTTGLLHGGVYSMLTSFESVAMGY